MQIKSFISLFEVRSQEYHNSFLSRNILEQFVDFWYIPRTRILRHKATELNLDMRSDGYVKVQELLQLNIKTFANVPLRGHTVDDVKEVGSFTSFIILFLYLLVFLHKYQRIFFKPLT